MTTTATHQLSDDQVMRYAAFTDAGIGGNPAGVVTAVGVVEDPATGAAAAAFGGYLRSLGLVALPARLTLLQGRDMGAPSRLLVDLDPDIDTVRVSGSATLLAKGDA